MVKFVKIPGTDEWVNPEHVTNICAYNPKFDLAIQSKIWVKADAGYGTKPITSIAKAAELAALLSTQEGN